jgi:Cof subfamily protein (haloacid dehalogenase superfamily)
MDGTLLNRNHSLSLANKQAINRLQGKGIMFILASGRPYESIYPYAKELDIDSPIIAANGAFIKNPLTNKVYYSSALPLDVTAEILVYGKENNYPMSLYSDDEVLTFDENMVKVHWDLEKVHARLINQYNGDKPLNKIIYSDHPQRIEAAFKFLEKKYKEKLYITRSDDIYLDIMNINASKGKALSHLLDSMNVSHHDVMVMGNSYNDVDMFKVAGLSIAMANSPQEVKNAANFVTKCNNEDGVAYALDRYFG